MSTSPCLFRGRVDPPRRHRSSGPCDDDYGGGDNIDFDFSGPFVDLEVVVEDKENGEVIELPVIRVKRSELTR